eukprot:TRINITY_DN12331_c0_g1_i1.p1 TRINITY_DN12331_c0_g1~~TRINITY_DN12331_c0_g1_i1.p1  ORF type:complete len:634 (+),score=137.50 TRINITY_DN12331_c0_g1_i1:27-1904(+)
MESILGSSPKASPLPAASDDLRGATCKAPPSVSKAPASISKEPPPAAKAPPSVSRALASMSKEPPPAAKVSADAKARPSVSMAPASMSKEPPPAAKVSADAKAKAPPAAALVPDAILWQLRCKELEAEVHAKDELLRGHDVQFQKLQQEQQEHATQLERMADQLAHLHLERDGWRLKCEELEMIMSSRSAEVERACQDLATKESLLKVQVAQCIELSSQLAQLQLEKDSWRSKCEEIQIATSSSSAEVERALQDLSAKAAQFEAQVAQSEQLTSQLECLVLERDELCSKCKELQQMLKTEAAKHEDAALSLSLAAEQSRSNLEAATQQLGTEKAKSSSLRAKFRKLRQILDESDADVDSQAQEEENVEEAVVPTELASNSDEDGEAMESSPARAKQGEAEETSPAGEGDDDAMDSSDGKGSPERSQEDQPLQKSLFPNDWDIPQMLWTDEEGTVGLVYKPAAYACDVRTSHQHPRLPLWLLEQGLSFAEDSEALAHRLDVGVSGMLVFGRDPAGARPFIGSQRAWLKEYVALIHGQVPRSCSFGSLTYGVKVDDGHSVTASSKHRCDEADFKEAVTFYQAQSYWSDGNGCKYTLIRLRLVHGRKHQIRVHLARFENRFITNMSEL